jgi:hypothetical protein
VAVSVGDGVNVAVAVAVAVAVGVGDGVIVGVEVFSTGWNGVRLGVAVRERVGVMADAGFSRTIE